MRFEKSCARVFIGRAARIGAGNLDHSCGLVFNFVLKLHLCRRI